MLEAHCQRRHWGFYRESPSVKLTCFKPLTYSHTQVKLWYAKVEYKLHLGILVSIWTPHVSHAESSCLTVHDASLVTSIFPERDNSCYFMVQEKSDEGVMCKTPLGYRDGKQLDGLMTLKGFIEGGNELTDGKILVCVKSIGGKRKCENYRARIREGEHDALIPSQSSTRKAKKPKKWTSTFLMTRQMPNSPSGVLSLPPRPAGNHHIQFSSSRARIYTAVEELCSR